MHNINADQISEFQKMGYTLASPEVEISLDTCEGQSRGHFMGSSKEFINISNDYILESSQSYACDMDLFQKLSKMEPATIFNLVVNLSGPH